MLVVCIHFGVSKLHQGAAQRCDSWVQTRSITRVIMFKAIAAVNSSYELLMVRL
jgi:hypothetical protein